MFRSDGTTGLQLNVPGGYSTHVVPGGQPSASGPQHVLPAGARIERQQGAPMPVLTQVAAGVQAMGPQQKTGAPGAQNGGDH